MEKSKIKLTSTYNMWEWMMLKTGPIKSKQVWPILVWSQSVDAKINSRIILIIQKRKKKDTGR